MDLGILGWLTAGLLALICLWLVTVTEHAYQTGRIEGQTEEIEKQIADRAK
jgi:hypothetical protein